MRKNAKRALWRQTRARSFGKKRQEVQKEPRLTCFVRARIETRDNHVEKAHVERLLEVEQRLHVRHTHGCDGSACRLVLASRRAPSPGSACVQALLRGVVLLENGNFELSEIGLLILRGRDPFRRERRQRRDSIACGGRRDTLGKRAWWRRVASRRLSPRPGQGELCAWEGREVAPPGRSSEPAHVRRSA